MFYVLDENNNKIEAYSKEEVLAVLQQAINDGTLNNIVANAAFVDKLKCCVGGETHKVAFVTQTKYNELVAKEQLESNAYYFITDDTTCDDIDTQLEAINEAINGINLNNENARKKTEALQYLTDFETTQFIYDSSKASQPKADISALLLNGKTGIDTVGVGGNIRVSLDGTNYIAFNFNTMWCRADEYDGEVTTYYGNVQGTFYTLDASPITYLIYFLITLNGEGKLGISIAPTCINVATGAKVDVNKMYVNNLMIYYK